MFALERQNKIREILYEYKQINVSSLAKILEVTEATIRKDLDLLEKKGFLKKIHGGAVLNEYLENEIFAKGVHTYSLKSPDSAEKQQIADICSRLIQNNDIIFLGGGDTCAYIADAILENNSITNITVITNNLYIVNRLSDIQYITLICLGGQLYKQDNTTGFYGQTTLQQFNDYYVTKAFFTVDAISIKTGYMVSKREYHDLISTVINRAGESYIVADYSKFDKISMLIVLPLIGIPRIITDKNVPDEYKTYCFKNNIQLFTTMEVPVSE